MKVKLINSHKLAFGFIKKSQFADDRQLYKLSSRFFLLAQKIYKIANAHLEAQINVNKYDIREINRQKLSEVIEDLPHKDRIYALFETLEFPYEINFGDTSSETRQKSLIKLFNLAITLQEKNISSDVALALAHMEPEILNLIQDGHRNIPNIEIPADYSHNNQTRADVLYQFLESRNQKYGFTNDKRMAFRNSTLILDIYLKLCQTDNLPQLSLERRDFLNLLYSEGEKFSYDMEHFNSALNLNYIMGKNSISFVQKCQLESKGNAIVDIPHHVDNQISFAEMEYSPNMSQFIVDNYFKINLKKQIENWVKKEYPGQINDAELKRIYDELMASDDLVNVLGEYKRKSDFERDAYTSLRMNLALILRHWNREVRVENDAYKTVQEIATNPTTKKLYPFEKISKILNEDITAEDIGYENIKNFPLFDALLKYQKDDIKSFLRLQNLYDNREEESDWYEELSKSSLENNSYIARVLPKTDIRFPFVGAITGCCQKLNGAGENAFQNTFGSHSGIFVITDKKDNIVAQSYIWINDATITLDSIESKYEKVFSEDFKDIYQRACNELFSRYFDVVMCGSNNTLFVISDQLKYVPLSIYGNNDPKQYTWDTDGGREVLYANPEKLDQYPFISVVSKANNNLTETYTQEEIDFLSTNHKFADMVEDVLLNKYTKDIDDSLNKENVLQYANDMKTAYSINYGTLSDDLIAMCEVFKNGVNFDSVTNQTQFQIHLNKWLRDGNYYEISNGEDYNGDEVDEQKIDKINEDLYKINQLKGKYKTTNLFKTQLLIYSDDLRNDLSKKEINDFIVALDDSQKDSLFQFLTDNISFKKLIEDRLRLTSDSYDEYGYKLYPFVSKIISKYITELNFYPEDMKLIQTVNLFKSFSDEDKIDLINNGFLDYYFSSNTKDPNIPNFSEMHNLKYIFSYYNDKIDNNKIKTFADKLLNNISNVDNGPVSQDDVWNLLTNFQNRNLITIDINNVNIQNLFSKAYVNEELPYEINTLYSSAASILNKKELLKFTPQINFVINTKIERTNDILRSLTYNDKIQKINIIVLEPEIVTPRFVSDCKMYGEKFNIRDEDKLKGIYEFLSDKELKQLHNRLSAYNTRSFTDEEFISHVERIITTLFDINSNPNAVDQMKQIILNKVNSYLAWHKEWMLGNQPEIPSPMPKEITTTPQTEEQNEITANDKRRLKYSIKIK